MTKNKIVLTEKVKNQIKIKEDLQLLTFQKPNSKWFYSIPVKLYIYNLVNDDGRETKFKWWMQNKIGEPPIIFKEPLIVGSAKSMKNYMFNNGYFHSKIIPTVKIKHKKAIVTYTVHPNIQHTIRNIVLPKQVDDITRIISNSQKESLLKSKKHLNINTLDDERQRLANVLRKKGYYYFSKEYFKYDIDTIANKKQADLILKIIPPLYEHGQEKFIINDVYIFTDYYMENRSDSLLLDSFDYEGYHFVTEKNNMRPKALLLAVFLKKGDFYNLENHKKTYRKLVSFGSFKTISIEYKINGNNQLDAFIFLTPAKKQIFTSDIELSHSSEGLSGSSVSISLSNKNLSRRSDLLKFKISGGVELNLFERNKTLINSADINTEVSYYLNRFIVPFPLKNISKNSNVKTKFSLSYNFENRIQRFTKHSITYTAGYEWNESQTKKHFYNPFSISLLLIPSKDPDFQAQLDSFPSLAHSFEENIILGSNYTFLMTNKKGKEDNSYFKFQGDLYLAGNVIHSIMLAANKNKSMQVPYKMLGKEYAQFARFESNIVQHNKINAHSELVTHFNAGIIIPYGNSKFAPYFQQFYSGGPNSLRAFRLRTIGPGSYANPDLTSNNFYADQSGDIKLEANIEYRFDLIWWFKWAFFIDAGNVWLLNKDVDRPNAEFTSKFYKDIAVGLGGGLRMDFSYFVIRTDLSIPAIDPRETQKWRLNKINLKDEKWRSNNLIFSLAIGYPF